MREFQGKPIMARIKAKPMNRMPIPPSVAAVKNGYRATPPTAVYDPAAYPPGQQRFIYANGTPGQPVTYQNQVHVYVSCCVCGFIGNCHDCGVLVSYTQYEN